MIRFAVTLALVAVSCTSAHDTANVADVGPKTFPRDCRGLSAGDSVACAEARFWPVFQRDFASRAPVFDLLGDLVAAMPESATKERARVHFYRGALALSMQLEEGGDYLARITPELSAAVALDPSHPNYPSWLDTMDLTTAFLQNDTAAFERAVHDTFDHVERWPEGNIPTVVGTLPGFPLASGLPQRAVALADRWTCALPWCVRNTERAPFGQPGLAFQWGDVYARVGDRDKALAWFRTSLARPGADRWPYRAVAQQAVDDIDGTLATYAALGEDKHALFITVGNRKYGCKLCHATE